MPKLESCPKCGGPAEILQDEVDIGVGLLTHIYGAECDACGEFAACNFCGAWTHQRPREGDIIPFQPHVAGCQENEPDAVGCG